MSFSRLFVLFKGHHVDRTHGVETCTHVAISLIFDRKLFATCNFDGCVGD